MRLNDMRMTPDCTFAHVRPCITSTELCRKRHKSIEDESIAIKLLRSPRRENV